MLAARLLIAVATLVVAQDMAFSGPPVAVVTETQLVIQGFSTDDTTTMDLDQYLMRAVNGDNQLLSRFGPLTAVGVQETAITSTETIGTGSAMPSLQSTKVAVSQGVEESAVLSSTMVISSTATVSTEVFSSSEVISSTLPTSTALTSTEVLSSTTLASTTLSSTAMTDTASANTVSTNSSVTTGSSLPVSTATCGDHVYRAKTAADILMAQYNETAGLWGSETADTAFRADVWWTSANIVTTLTQLASFVGEKQIDYEGMFQTTFQGAQAYRLSFKSEDAQNYAKLKDAVNTNGAGNAPLIQSSFYDDFYDDEGWWALAWIRAFDLTTEQKYLEAAEDIFSDMTKGYDGSKCGGLLWHKGTTYVASIANELFFATAVALSSRSSDGGKYIEWAKKEWNWFKDCAVWDGDTIADGLKDDCTPDKKVWTYNQGVILGALVDMSAADSGGDYMTKAHSIAQSAIKEFSQDGVLIEKCETEGCGDRTMAQFKGIFIRNLAKLHRASPKPEYAQFITANAVSLWANYDGKDFIHMAWSSKLPSQFSSVSSHASALDCLVEAIGVNSCST